MNIARISKREDLKGRFQSCYVNGLIDFSNQGYEKWYWKYAENPFFPGQYLPMWVCNVDGRAAGYLGAIPTELKVGPRKVNAAWAVDFVVLPEYKRKGHGISLVKEANQHFDAFLAIGGTDMSTSLFTKMEWVLLGYVPYYIKVWDASALLESRIKNLLITTLVFIIVNPFFKIYNYLKKPRRPRGIEIRRIESFDEEAELFWEKIESFYRIVVPRGKAFLNWKYDLQPGMCYVKFRAARGRQVCGYIVARAVKTGHFKTEGLIVDIIARPDDRDAVNALVLAALKYLKSEGCSVVRCCINNKNIERVISECGFIKRKPHLRFLVKKNLDGLEQLYKLDNWHITAGDSDIDR